MYTPQSKYHKSAPSISIILFICIINSSLLLEIPSQKMTDSKNVKTSFGDYKIKEDEVTSLVCRQINNNFDYSSFEKNKDSENAQISPFKPLLESQENLKKLTLDFIKAGNFVRIPNYSNHPRISRPSLNLRSQPQEISS